MKDPVDLEAVRQKTIVYIYIFFAFLLLFFIGMGWMGIVPMKPSQYGLNTLLLGLLGGLVYGFRRGRIGYGTLVGAGVVLGVLHLLYTLHISTYNELRIVWFFPLLLFTYLYGGRRVGAAVTVVSLVAGHLFAREEGCSSAALLTYDISVVTVSVVSLFFIAKFEEISKTVRETQARLHDHAFRDYLTGVLNRRGFFETVDKEECGTLVVMDLDRFKAINDRYGHVTGDAYLRHLVALLQRSVTGREKIARFGGDEFVILFPGAETSDVQRWLEAFYRHLRAHPFRTGEVDLPLSVSAGVALFEDSIDAALEAADWNLYRAKKERGRWCDDQGCYRPA